jgi:hypothetical protein
MKIRDFQIEQVGGAICNFMKTKEGQKQDAAWVIGSGKWRGVEVQRGGAIFEVWLGQKSGVRGRARLGCEYHKLL